PHQVTDEFKKFLDTQFNATEKQAMVGSSPKSTTLPETISRGLDNFTVNEVNNMAREGRLGEVYKDFPKFKQFNRKVFDDDIVSAYNKRYLDHVKVTGKNDFLQATSKTYGMSDDAFRNGTRMGELNSKDYVKVASPSLPDGEQWFPKQVGEYLNGVDKSVEDPKIRNLFTGVNDYVKLFNYGIWPGSAGANYISNQLLAHLGGIYDPIAQIQGLNLDRLLKSKNFTNKQIVAGFTDKQVVDLAIKHRALGGGLT